MKLNKIIKVIIILILLLLVYVAVQLYLYRYEQKQNEKFKPYCEKINTNIYQTVDFKRNDNKYFKSVIEDPKSCYCRMRTLLSPRLLVYKVKSENEDLKLIKSQYYEVLIPENILKKADLYLNYNIPQDYRVVDLISKFYKKPVYFFYCDNKIIKNENPNFYYYNTCFNIKKKRYKKENTFKENIQAINAEDKKIYLNHFLISNKDDINHLKDILNSPDNILGMTIRISLNDAKSIISADELLKSIEKNFILVANTNALYAMNLGCKCKYVEDKFSGLLSLTYINKNIADEKTLPIIHDYNYMNIHPSSETILIHNKSNWIVILNKKLEDIFNKMKNKREINRN